MRNLIILINLSIIIAITSIFTQSEKAESKEETKGGVSQASSLSTTDISSEIGSAIRSTFPKDEVAAEETNADKAIASFLTEMAESRMIHVEGGKTASQRATSRPLKDFGALINSDHLRMLDDLKKIANKKTVKTPEWIRGEEASALNDLRAVHGKAFDKKYVKVMMSDLKRDVKVLRRATESPDADIQVFATKYLPLMEGHLAKAKALKKSL